MKFFKSAWLHLTIYVLSFIGLSFHLFDVYSTFKTSLSDGQLHTWQALFIFLIIVFSLGILEAGLQLFKKKEFSILTVLNIVGVIGVTTFYIANHTQLIPSTIAGFMWNELNVYGIFLSVSVGLTLFLMIKLALANIHKHLKISLLTESLVALSIPILIILIFYVLIPAINTFSTAAQNTLITFLILSTTVFIYLIVRIALQTFAKQKRFKLFWTVLFSLVLPIIGLLINNGGVIMGNPHPIFGDFNHPLIWAMLVLTAFALLFPVQKFTKFRFAMMLLKAFTISYTIYFTLIFLPYLPISLLAVLVLGFGLLLIAPICLLLLQITSIYDDFKAIQSISPSKKIISLLLSAIIVPVAVFASMLNEKMMLKKIINYTEHYDSQHIKTAPKINKTYTLNLLDKLNENENRLLSKMPIITPLRNKIVRNNLTLKEEKINRIQKVFTNYGAYIFQQKSRNQFQSSNQDFTIDKTDIQTTYNHQKGYYESWVNLTVTNQLQRWNQEFVTLIDLQENTFINDMFLMIGSRKEKAILSEKKSANWIYNQIKTVQQDPAILQYEALRTLSFKIFPFAGGETRKAGIHFIHLEPTKISINGNEYNLHPATKRLNVPKTEKLEQSIFLSKEMVEKLPEVQRTPKPIVLVQAFQNQDEKDYAANQLTQIAETYQIEPNLLNVFQVGKDFKLLNANNYLNQEKTSETNEGFFVEKPILHTLNKVKTTDNTYPIFHILQLRPSELILNHQIAYLSHKVPECNFIRIHNRENKSILMMNPFEEKREFKFVKQYNYKGVNYFIHPYESAIITNTSSNSTDFKNDLEYGAYLQNLYSNQALNPAKANLNWKKSVVTSIKSNILTPNTTFIALENELQKAILKKKQKQILNSNSAFDAETNNQVTQMSEPVWIYALLPILLYFIYRKRKKYFNTLKINNK